MVRQLYLGALDMTLHDKFDAEGEETVFAVQQRLAQSRSVLQPLAEDRFPCGFMHIFAGGYAAGYYSYKWAEVLSADAFSAFEEVGLDNDDEIRRLGRKFRDTILAKGGSIHPEDNFVDMRGRKPNVTALLKSYGLF